VLIPLLIYALVYLPFYRLAQDQSFIGFILRYQQEMFNFHTAGKIGVTHPFNSPWWSWPLNLKPDEVWFGSAANSSTASAISLMGNPLIWFGGLVAIVFALWQGVTQKKSLALFLSLSGLSLYLPWVLMGHYTFIYYFYIAIPLWILALTYLLLVVYNNGGKFAVYFYLLIVAALFVIYYPDISGIEFARNYVLNHLHFY
jgi:dolichyl-phosphate-mannose--protein O-mannosyl transferase